MITQEERKIRLSKANEMMREKGFQGLLIVGNGSVATKEYGFYRYFVDNRIYYHMQILVMVTDEAPTVCCGSLTHLKALNARGFQDVRMVGDALIEGVIDILKDRGVTQGTIGYCAQTMPAGWYRKLCAALPGLTLVDCADALFRIRLERSQEERDIAAKCATLADAAYEEACQVIRPGLTEGELVARLDYAMKKRGAEETFTLMTSGQLGSENGGLGHLKFSANSPRALQKGDCVSLEITPRLDGYWTQMVRTICVGQEDPLAAELQAAISACIQNVVPLLRPGVPVGELSAAVCDYAQQMGYRATMPYGHICGVDLNESRLDSLSDITLTDGMTVILHPSLIKEDMHSGIYWGETYMVTAQGGVCLMRSGQDLQTTNGDGDT